MPILSHDEVCACACVAKSVLAAAAQGVDSGVHFVQAGVWECSDVSQQRLKKEADEEGVVENQRRCVGTGD